MPYKVNVCLTERGREIFCLTVFEYTRW